MGDGKFHWYYGIGKEPETYHGKCSSLGEAVAQALSEDGKEHGFTVVEADRSVASDNIFDADSVLEQYEEHNELCWGEDGPEIEATSQQRADLEQMLAAALSAWFEKHGNRPTPWAFGTMRNQKYYPPHSAVSAA